MQQSREGSCANDGGQAAETPTCVYTRQCHTQHGLDPFMGVSTQTCLLLPGHSGRIGDADPDHQDVSWFLAFSVDALAAAVRLPACLDVYMQECIVLYWGMSEDRRAVYWWADLGKERFLLVAVVL